MYGTELMCVDEKLLSIWHADLIENVGQMMPDRTVGNAQAMGNLLVRKSLSHQSDNLSFSLGYNIEPLRRLYC